MASAFAAPGAAAQSTCGVAGLTGAATTAEAGDLRRLRLAENLRAGFGIQYWGDDYGAPELSAANQGLLFLEAARVGAPFTGTAREQYFDREEIARIGDGGRRLVIGYINVGEIEPYRDYWADELRSALGSGSETGQRFNWYGPESLAGERLARYWTPDWEEVTLSRVDRIMALGFDGILLDDVLHYYTMATAGVRDKAALSGDGVPRDAAGFSRAMMRLIVRIAARARQYDCGAVIVVNNGAYIGRDAGPEPAGGTGPSDFDIYRDAIDGILMESLFAPNANPEAVEVVRADYQSVGINVLTVDFASYFPDQAPDDVRADIALRAETVGFAPYVADNASYDRLYPPITGSELPALQR